MAEQTINKVQLDLNTYRVHDQETGTEASRTAQANVYTVEGVTDSTGAPRQLSIAELVMVVCLARAAEKEAAVIQLMKSMSDNTSILESLTDIESKLLEGTALDDITDFYPYQGKDYSAKNFLAIVIGGAVPNDDSEMVNLWNQLANNHIIEVTGNYTYNGVTYTKAYEYLYARGLNMSTGNAYSFHEICSYADNLPDGYVLTYNDLVNISRYNGVDNLWEGMTKEDLIQEIDNKYKTDILNYVQTLGWQASGIPDPDSYLPSSTDELITQIESKMDSLNSFSQQKMIELQSETNKRDQSYDLITNILKSLNTVQVGISNNI